jgi:hypothetical protein
MERVSLGLAAILCLGVAYVSLPSSHVDRISLVSSDMAARETMRRAIQAAGSQSHLAHGVADVAPVRVFPGSSMLCAEGETSCEHPCDAFYTITGESTNCTCKVGTKDHAVVCQKIKASLVIQMTMHFV